MAKAQTPETPWTTLTWDNLERWAGSRSVSRGRAYQRGERVKNLCISQDGELLATVVGSSRYATRVSIQTEKKKTSLQSTCTCPIGSQCKHAVAVVAEYLDAIANDRPVPTCREDDPRWQLFEAGASTADDWEGDFDESEDGDDEDGDDEVGSDRPTRRSKPAPNPQPVDWDDRIKSYLAAKSKEQLVDLVFELAREFPSVSREFRETISLQQGDQDQLIAECRRLIRKVTEEPGWRHHWDGEGHTPDYSPIRQRLERLLQQGHADEVVSLGRTLIRDGLRQVGQSDDEGETAMAFASCLPVIFRAVNQSSLSGPERLLLAIDAILDDELDTVSEATEPILASNSRREDWSKVADTLLRRLESHEPGEDSYSRNYKRDRISYWAATALENAGRSEEVLGLYESEARATSSYDRLVSYLLEQKKYKEATHWAQEGIAATRANYPGIAASLARKLCDAARGRKQWDVVASHAAYEFFDRPSTATFDELVKAAEKAGVGEPVRAAALRFLEQGTPPYRVVTGPAPKLSPTSIIRSPGRKRSGKHPAGVPEPAMRLVVDRSWPLPMPDYLAPLLQERRAYSASPRPQLHVLLQMAIDARNPDQVLYWFDRMRTSPRQPGDFVNWPQYADRVADAVATAYPERAIEIYRAAMEPQLRHANQSAYESVGAYLRKLRKPYQTLGRVEEWQALVSSIREQYKNRPRFMEVLDNIEGRTILQSSRKRK